MTKVSLIIKLSALVVGLTSLAPTALSQITIDRIELRQGNALRLQGSNAAINSTILVDGTVRGTADDRGDFNIQFSPYFSDTCVLVASDGASQASSPIPNCTPAPPTNQAPTANAGVDISMDDLDLNGSESVTLNGTLSVDLDGTLVSYVWTRNGIQLATGSSPLVLLSLGVHFIDLVVTDDAGDTGTDQVVVTANSGVPLPATIERSAPDVILESNQIYSGTFTAAGMGASVASAGDVNGDGFDDVIVGAPGWDAQGGSHDEGAAFVFLGGPSGIVGGDPSTAHAVILSSSPGARFGSSVSSAGDVNGDGFDDIIVGAPLHSASGLGASGAAFLFHGGPLGITATSSADANAVLESKQLTAHMGTSVARAGDVNGDGFDDVVVGAIRFGEPFVPPIANQGSGRQGAAFVFLGSPTGIVGTDPATAQAQLVPWSAGAPTQVTARFGWRVAGAGDVNADGYDDVIIGCPSWNFARPWPGVPGGDPPQEGAAFVFLGSPTGIVGHDPTDAHARIESGMLDAFMGSDVGSAGDVNGDGFGDIIVGAVGFPISSFTGKPQEGAVFVFLGSPAGITANSPASAQVMFQGSMLSEWVGGNVASAGDVDGDGFGDVAFGARIYPGSLNNEGVVYVFRGGPGGIQGTSLSQAYMRIVSLRPEAWLGSGLASAGDVDGDFVPDLILGVTGFENGQASEGGAFVYTGVPSLTPPNQAPIAEAGPNQTVRDIDGDGLQTVSLNGGASFDVDGSIVFYEWFESAAPVGSGVPATASLSVGNHLLTLVVTDDKNATGIDTMAVTVLPAIPNVAPVSRAGADQSVIDTDGDGFASVTLNGSASFDPDGTIVSYQWSEAALPLGATPSMQVLLPVGVHMLSLLVTDNGQLTHLDTVVIDVLPTPPPQQAQITIVGSTLASRGQAVSWTVTLTNTGGTTLTSLQVALDLSNSSVLKNLSPGGIQAVADLLPGASAVLVWNAQADREGTSSVTSMGTSAGVTLDTAALQLTVVK